MNTNAHEPIFEFLSRNKARCIHEYTATRGRPKLAYFRMAIYLDKNNVRFIITQHWDVEGKLEGWDIFIPAFNGNNPARTIEEAQSHLDSFAST